MEARFRAAAISSLDAIAAMGLVLMSVFLVWLATAELPLSVSTGHHRSPESIGQFLSDIFTTPAGWTLIIAGNGIGFLFAVLGAEYQRSFSSCCS